jgi:DNA-binding NtrC family response regulator
MAHILVVDDERSTCDALEVILQRTGHAVQMATSGKEALTRLQQQEVDLLLSDVKMPEVDGLALLRHVKAQDPGIAVVMMSGHHDVATIVQAMRAGAFDYLVKPFGKDEVVRTVEKALTLRALLVENLELKRQMGERFARAQVIGSSPAWRRIREIIEQIAPLHTAVLLTGESGTGKGLIAGLLHRLSPRADRPFITLTASALPVNVLEAELFGYENETLTGAQHSKPGRFELAEGGTLFLDEISEIPLEVQVKLLRVLQEGTFEHLGGTHTLRVDVRVVAATNKDLAQEVAEQRFRADLYCRLNVISLQLPPLRERREDIPLLAAHFVRKYAQRNQKKVRAIQRQALQRLQAYDWPGNVRQLENVIEQAVMLTQGATITVADLGLDYQYDGRSAISGDYFVLPAHATLAQIEREAIVQALKRHAGNRQVTAHSLGIGVATLYRKRKEYQIQF